MDTHPKVSVIVPNYNHAPYLEARIGSILNQTFQDFELILLDDASTDGSADILRSYADNLHTVCVDINPQNTGSPFRQWLKGIGMARGEYVWLAESDDTADPHFLETTVHVLEHHPKAAFCFCGSTLIDSRDIPLLQDIDRWKTQGHTPLPDSHAFDGKTYIARNLYWRCYIANASSALFRKACALKADTQACASMRYSGDWLFWTEMALQGDVVEVYKKLNFFRQHEQKVTVKADREGGGRIEDADILARMEQIVPDLPGWKRKVRRGILYNKVDKLHIPAEDKQQIFQQLKQRLGAGRADGRAAHLNHWLRLVWPWAPTMKRERLLP